MAEKNDRLNCSICLNDFKKPKILDCFHSFCESCLCDHVSKYEENGEFMCPLCRRNIQIPTGGVKDLASNVYIEERQSVHQPESNPPCNICDKDIQSEFRCKDCDKFLCGSCKTSHDLFVSGLNHYVISLDEADQDDVKPVRHVICQHHQKKFAVYCSDCSKVICSKCSKKDHERHTTSIINNKDSNQFIKAAKASLEKLKKDIDRQIQRLCDCRDMVKTSSSELHESITTACKLVDKQVTAICKSVKSQGEIIKLDIKKSELDEYELNQMHEEIVALIDELKKGNGEVSEDLTTGDTADLLDGFPDLRNRSMDLENKPFCIPDFKLPSLAFGDGLCQEVLRKIIGQIEYTQSIQHTFSSLSGNGNMFSSPYFVVEDTRLCIQLKYYSRFKWGPTIYLQVIKGDLRSPVTLKLPVRNTGARETQKDFEKPDGNGEYKWVLTSISDRSQTPNALTITAIFNTL